MATTLTGDDDVYSTTTLGEDVNGLSGNDTITGDSGSNTFNGNNGDDILYGMAGDDILSGNNGSDTLVGGADQDVLAGGGGADTFNYSFTVASGPSVTLNFTDWLGTQGYAGAVEGGEVKDGTTQSFFAVQYTAWLNELVNTYGLGADLDGDGKVSVGLNQNDPTGTPYIEGMSATDLAALFGDRESVTLKTGKTTQDRYYSDSFTIGGGTSISSADGQDIITDFSRSQGDKLDFGGLTAEQFAAYFSASVVDADSDGQVDDTVITLSTDSSWSLTLLGYTGFDAALDVNFHS